MQPPALQDVYPARRIVYRHLAPTPLIRSAAMSDALGCGSGLSGHCIVAKTLNPAGKVIGVQAEKAPAAAARKLGDRLRGKTVVLIVSGCNITREQLTRVLTDPQPW